MSEKPPAPFFLKATPPRPSAVLLQEGLLALRPAARLWHWDFSPPSYKFPSPALPQSGDGVASKEAGSHWWSRRTTTRLLHCEGFIVLLLEGLRKNERWVHWKQSKWKDEATIKSKKNKRLDKKRNIMWSMMWTLHYISDGKTAPVATEDWLSVCIPAASVPRTWPCSPSLLHGPSPWVIPLFCVKYHITASQKRSPGHRSWFQERLGSESFPVPMVR